MTDAPLKKFVTQVRVTYREEWRCEAANEEEARRKFLISDLVSEHQIECIDWDVSGSIREDDE
jgi:hypothetical protein